MRTRCGVLLIRREDARILTVTEKARGEYGYITQTTTGIPKGLCESYDSSILATARRELFEETGIVLNIKSFLFPYFAVRNREGVLYVFPAVVDGAKITPKAGPEIASVQWQTLGELRATNISRTTESILDVLETLLDETATTPN